MIQAELLLGSQKDRVLANLRAAGLRGVCSVQWYSGGIPNARNRIVELRQAGWCIVAAPCGDTHDAPYARYVFLHGQERTCRACRPAPVQLVFLL